MAGGLSLCALTMAPFPALADLTNDSSYEIAAAADSAMTGAEDARLKTLLSGVVEADAVAAAKVAIQRIASDVTSDTADRAKLVTADIITAMVAASPGQTGAVLNVAIGNLPPALRTAAVSAAQAALSPAAGSKVLIGKTTCIAPNKGLPCRTWQVPLNPNGPGESR